MIRVVLLLCLFCIKCYGIDFVAQEGKYQDNFVKSGFVDLNKDRLKCINAILKESARYDLSLGGTRKVKLPSVDRSLILKDKNDKNFEVMIATLDKGKTIVYLNLTVTEKEKEKLDQLVRILEKELKTKKKETEKAK